MARNEVTLRAAIELGAWAIAIASTAVLFPALVAELIRRSNADSVVVVLADRLLPTRGHQAAVALLAVLSTVMGVLGSQAASADESIRGWLGAPPIPAAAPTSPVGSTMAGDDPPSTASSTTTTTAIAGPPPPEVAAPRPAVVVRETPMATPPAHDRPTAPTQVPAPATPPPMTVPAPAITYMVQPGDCLWSIASLALGPRATNSDIDRGWRSVYDANRAAIGDDPGLIHPGLVLSVTTLATSP